MNLPPFGEGRRGTPPAPPPSPAPPPAQLALTVALRPDKQGHALQPLHVARGHMPGAPVVPLPSSCRPPPQPPPGEGVRGGGGGDAPRAPGGGGEAGGPDRRGPLHSAPRTAASLQGAFTPTRGGLLPHVTAREAGLGGEHQGGRGLNRPPPGKRCPGAPARIYCPGPVAHHGERRRNGFHGAPGAGHCPAPASAMPFLRQAASSRRLRPPPCSPSSYPGPVAAAAPGGSAAPLRSPGLESVRPRPVPLRPPLLQSRRGPPRSYLGRPSQRQVPSRLPPLLLPPLSRSQSSRHLGSSLNRGARGLLAHSYRGRAEATPFKALTSECQYK
ncbi:basic proline-rich protein-like [Antechinus flavipes]|uniref:basic proline-rich protein-like n=1 Tax=Antechinus flavipes TaxID=38775 RepID=UPI002236A3F0|nr:basic proline-rich protein-like [Antechinus flavipes]